MKKIYTLVAAVAVAGTITAQTTIDFENHPLSGPETHDNGNDGVGAFDFGGVTFDYSFNQAGNYFSGFAISNETDVTTAGYLNQYSAYTGEGANGSSNFAIFYSFSGNGINTNVPNVRVESFELTNTTYAYLSMRDGDGYGKEFGTLYAAGDSIPDGTNGEDFFYVRIYGHNFDQTEVDSIDFYLADYRFADSTQDYIIDDWNTIDLTGFAFDVTSVTFDFFSSDVNSFGIKTPAYIAIDDVKLEISGGVTQLAQDYSAYPNPVQNVLTIKGGQGQIRITNTLGQVVLELDHNEVSEIDASKFNSGAYFITLIDDFGIRTKQFIK
ncbi:MAG: DUF4465 domain-containing protein [Crocinitomicaceae bacterium]